MKGYRAAVEWIALNDEPTVLGIDAILEASALTIALVADLVGKDDREVAKSVHSYRWIRSGTRMP